MLVKQKEKGITLIALAVTIVVLLILAAITISYVFSDDGLIKKAQEAANAMNNAVENDIESINDFSNKLNELIDEVANGGRIPEGAIKFSEIEWKDGVASVKVSTEEEGYVIEWQKNGVEDGKWTEIENGGTIENLANDDIVFARLKKDNRVGKEASVKIEDLTGPKITVESNSSTSNSVTVTVSAIDEETGLEEPATYSYYIKETTADDSTYVEKQKDGNTTSTIGNLRQNTSYTVKVEVKDKAGNVGSITQEITTGTVTSGTEEGAIIFTNKIWSGGVASVTISTNSSYMIEWQKNDIAEGNWTRIENGGTVGNLANDDIVFARLTDGVNVGQEASVKIEDLTAPTISGFVVTATEKDSITVQTTASDSESGIGKYEYKKGSEGYVEGSATYIFSGLTPSTSYTFTVQVTDKAGNVNTATVSGTTKADLPNVGDITSPVGGNTDAVDDLGNKVKIPGGFQVVEGTKVEEGIVIQDSSGNQFVWIPVGPIKKSDGSTVTITLGRYTFNSSGTPSSPYSANQSINGAYIEINGRRSDGITSYDNAGPININDFISKTNSAGGYYIARYEASYGGGSGNNSYPLSQVSTSTSSSTSRTRGQLWRYVKQTTASEVCRNMYEGNRYVTSDLTNSFAWDTALVFIQNCSSNPRYSRKSSTKTLGNTGKNNDEVCHIHDMAGNLKELTTETSTTIDQNNVNYSCVPRGDSYGQSSTTYYSSSRVSARLSADDFDYGFRPILYFK